MAKIKLTKGELKRQRDSLDQFRHFLPTLQLKKQQLQMKIGEARRAYDEKEAERRTKAEGIERWAGLLADPWLPDGLELDAWTVPTRVRTEILNIAGANVPLFEGADFKDADYDLAATPLWLDSGVAELKALATLTVEAEVLQRQIAKLTRELRVTTQRVNLFEKVKIPECQDNIRKIRIYLGDLQANAVGISKVAKKKIEQAAALAG